MLFDLFLHDGINDAMSDFDMNPKGEQEVSKSWTAKKLKPYKEGLDNLKNLIKQIKEF